MSDKLEVSAGGGDWECNGFMDKKTNRCYPTRKARRQGRREYRKRNKR